MKKLGFGMMRLPVFDENDRSTVDMEEVKKMVDLYMNRDFTYFDTAHSDTVQAIKDALDADRAKVEAWKKDSITTDFPA